MKSSLTDTFRYCGKVRPGKTHYVLKVNTVTQKHGLESDSIQESDDFKCNKIDRFVLTWDFTRDLLVLIWDLTWDLTLEIFVLMWKFIYDLFVLTQQLTRALLVLIWNLLILIWDLLIFIILIWDLTWDLLVLTWDLTWHAAILHCCAVEQKHNKTNSFDCERLPVEIHPVTLLWRQDGMCASSWWRCSLQDRKQ